MKRVVVSFPRNLGSQPIISETILKTGTAFNILKAEVNATKSELVGEIRGDEKKAREFVEELRARGVIVTELESLIKYDREKCVQCTYCSCLCPTKAITQKQDMTVAVDFSACVLCKACVENCPVKAFSYLG